MTDFQALNEEKVEEHNQRVYGGEMPARAKKIMREMLESEDAFWQRFDRDHIHGYDDGEPQTQADYGRS